MRKLRYYYFPRLSFYEGRRGGAGGRDWSTGRGEGVAHVGYVVCVDRLRRDVDLC